jgi:anthranilate synthase component I
MNISPTRQEFHKLAASHTVLPVWTEMLADVETPVAAYMKLVGDKPGFLLESVDHGERWSRYSFVGRDPLATLTLRDGNISIEGQLPATLNTSEGMLAAMESLLSVYTSPMFPELPPLQGGLMGFLGYDVVREVEHLPNTPHDDRNLPDAVMCMIGSLAAFDHWKQRVYLLESVPVYQLSSAQIDAAYDAAIVRIHQAVADLTKPLSYLPVEPPTEEDKLQQFVAPTNGSAYQRSV